MYPNLNFTIYKSTSQINKMPSNMKQDQKEIPQEQPVSIPEFTITPQMLATYDSQANKLMDKETLLINMSDTKGILGNSGLAMDDIKKVVFLSNPTKGKTIKKGQLIVLLHLIYVKKKIGSAIPSKLPIEQKIHMPSYDEMEQNNSN